MEHLTLNLFKEKIFDFEKDKEWKFKGEKPCIIDFYADWCGSCKMVTPILEQLSKDYAGKVDIYKIDTEKEQDLAALFGVQSIPSILFVPIGEQPQMSMGALPKHVFVDAIKNVLHVE